MGTPEPIYALTGHCSIVHEETLYVYSPAGFQSLRLKEGAKWKREPMDISLTGAQCVKAVPGGNPDAAALYIVGGTVNDTAASWDYPGLMYYSFAQKKWDWIRSESWVTQNRLNHAAAYIESAESLLVYSGSQDAGNIDPSSSTFLISTKQPYRVRSSPSNDAPPAVRPLLLPWDNRSAVLLGGGPQNTAVYLFDADAGWRNLGVTLTEPFSNQDAVQATVVTGKDGTKVLERYDMSVSPNRVTRIALVDKDGKPAAPGTTVGDKTKRATVSEWQAYNSTNAPKVTRTGFSLAQSDENLAIVSGGNEEDPLCIFNQEDNAWLNTTELFAGRQAVIQSTPSGTTSLEPTSASPTATSTEAPVAAAPANNKNRMLTVLGATLGAIFGIAAILILILFCLKYRKAKKQKAQQSGYVEKDRLSFADRGAEFMSEAGGALGHKYAQNNQSSSSLAILSGQTGANHSRGLGSDASTAGLVMKKGPLGYSEPVELAKFDLKPEPAEEEETIVRQNSGRNPPKAVANISRSRSSGWSKYFANNEATNLAHMPSGRSTYASERTSTGSQSEYPDSRMVSQTVPPLDIPKFENQRVSKVQSGSPTLGNSQENLHAQPMQAELARANSNGSVRSVNAHDHYYSSAPVESWTPVDHNERPPSSTYTNSMVGEPRPHDGASSYYHDGTSSYYPKSSYSSFYPTPVIPQNETRDSTLTVFPGAHGPGRPVAPANNDDTHTFRMPPRIGGTPEDRESTLTVFPGGVPDRGPRKNEDMSWLNLGAGK
jgi:hypothetical protein